MSNYNPFSLLGKTVLVTGASSGIGQASAIECAQLGAHVIITGRNVDRLNTTFSRLEGSDHQQIFADLTSADDLNRLVDGSPALDGVVLCAGRGMTLPFQFCTRDKYDEIFNVNFFSPAELLRLLVKRKRLVKGASVVFVGSIGGVFKFGVCNSIYGATKAALGATMKYCAKELAPKKIRVNSVNPGMTRTPLIAADKITEEQLKLDMEKYPLKRYGEPEDIAHGISYLLSDASSWMTGHALVIDGGLSI